MHVVLAALLVPSGEQGGRRGERQALAQAVPFKVNADGAELLPL